MSIWKTLKGSTIKLLKVLREFKNIFRLKLYIEKSIIFSYSNKQNVILKRYCA